MAGRFVRASKYRKLYPSEAIKRAWRLTGRSLQAIFTEDPPERYVPISTFPLPKCPQCELTANRSNATIICKYSLQFPRAWHSSKSILTLNRFAATFQRMLGIPTSSKPTLIISLSIWNPAEVVLLPLSRSPIEAVSLNKFPFSGATRHQFSIPIGLLSTIHSSHPALTMGRSLFGPFRKASLYSQMTIKGRPMSIQSPS